MKNKPSGFIAALLLSFAIANGADTAKNLPGSWQGTLDTGQVKLRVAFNISQAADGGLTATMDSLDQGARGIPVDSVTATGESIVMEVKVVQGGFKGTIDVTGNTIGGQWTQGPNSLPLRLTKGQGSSTASAPETLSPGDLTANKAAAQKIAGVWNGTLAAGATSLRLRINITKTDAGAAIGTMDSLDQGANGIPLSAITLREGTLHFEVRGINGVYEGKLAADGTALSGQWKQGGNSLPLELRK